LLDIVDSHLLVLQTLLPEFLVIGIPVSHQPLHILQICELFGSILDFVKELGNINLPQLIA